MDMNSILIIVGIVVSLGVAGGCLFGVMKLRKALTLMDTKVEPKLNELKKITSGLVPAVGQAEGIFRQVNVTMDALDQTLLDVDDKLGQIKNISSTVIATGEAGSKVAKNTSATVKGKVKGLFAKKG